MRPLAPNKQQQHQHHPREEEASLLDREYNDNVQATRRHKDRPVEWSSDGVVDLFDFARLESNAMLEVRVRVEFLGQSRRVTGPEPSPSPELN